MTIGVTFCGFRPGEFRMAFRSKPNFRVGAASQLEFEKIISGFMEIYRNCLLTSYASKRLCQ